MAETPWGDLPVSDAHVHLFSHVFFTGLATQKKAGNAEALGPILGWEIPSPDPAELATRWVGELHGAGVQHASLIASTHGDEGSVASAVAFYPDRFYGYFFLDPTQPDALDRVRRAASNRHLHGVCLFPAMHRYFVGDPRCLSVIEIAAANRLAVFVHCGALSVGVRKRLGLPSLFDMRFSNPLELHAVALQFPQTSFIIPHFGAGLFREALMLADLCPNILFDTSSTNSWMKYEGLDLVTVFRRALDVLGAGRLLFGSDSSFFPRGWHSAILQQQVAALRQIGLSAGDARQILGSNLERIHQPRTTGGGRV